MPNQVMGRWVAQLSLPVPCGWGGRRAGAGRKPTPGRRPGVPHRTRVSHAATHPVHVTLRASRAIRCLRAARVFPAVHAALAVASRDAFRVIHFSVQDDHLHLIVEAEDRSVLARGIQGLAIRVARAVNRALGRRGAVWGDRYHARALTTPRAVRHAIVYVLMNFKKHGKSGGGIDACSSAPWFEGWSGIVDGDRSAPAPVSPARTWLARAGWRRHGLVGVYERPAT